MTEAQRKQRYKLILFAEAVIVFLMLTLTVSDFITGNKGYDYYSLVLLVLYIISLIFSFIDKGKGASNHFICITFVLNFLFSFYIKGNDGIGSIWLLLLPTLTMYVFGITYGFHASLNAFVLLLVLVIVPVTRHQLIERYTIQLLIRYIILYSIDFALATVAMFNMHQLRILENKSQKELEEAVVAEHNNVVSISMQTIIAISNAVEAKDIHIGKHSMRVAHFACLLAEKLGWSKSEIQRINTIAMLHDIGKIGIESKILNKESQLTADEFEKLKEHTTIGGKILKDFTVVPRVDFGANYHHEHFDGAGYPEGLGGKKIPIEARIICIADSFDAMKYPRGYKETLTSEQIKEEFLLGRGKQFDPEFTDLFLQVCEENNWFDDYEVQK